MTVIVYVFNVAPSCAVSTTSIVLIPTFSDKEPEALPLVILDQLPLFTLTPNLALASLRVAVNVTEFVAFVTDAVYEIVADANAGDNVPELNERAERVASEEPARVIVIVYVFIVVPSCAVSTTSIVLIPTFSDKEFEALPLVILDQLPLFTLAPNLALASLREAVTVIAFIALATEAVYEVVADANAGDNVPELNERAESVASAEAARVMVMV